jgi:hypothetical protein
MNCQLEQLQEFQQQLPPGLGQVDREQFYGMQQGHSTLSQQPLFINTTQGVTGIELGPRINAAFANAAIQPGQAAIGVHGNTHPNPHLTQNVLNTMNEHNHQRTAPILPGRQAQWTPPYAYDPTPPGAELPFNIPSIMLHQDYTRSYPEPVIQQIDPPIAAEAQVTIFGATMQMPSQHEHNSNRYVRELTENIHRTGPFRTDEPPIPAYNPYANEASPPTSAAAASPGIFGNQPLATQLTGVHDLMQYRMQKGKGKGRTSFKGQGKGKPRQDVENADLSQYEGTDTQCTICSADFCRGEPVYRIVCNHLFHSECWEEFLLHDDADRGCPNCRGPPIPKARYLHLGNPDVSSGRRATAAFAAEARRNGPRRPGFLPPTSSSESSYTSVQSVATIHMINETEVTFTADEISEHNSSWSPLSIIDYYSQKNGVHGNTHPTSEPAEVIEMRGEWQKIFLGKDVGPGKHHIMIDVGSMVNVIGKNTERSLSNAAFAKGHKTIYTRKDKPLLIGGVGSGHARCEIEAKIPIAVKFDDRPATRDMFTANIATGSGENLPAILGTNSMKQMDSVLCLRDGKEFIAFPGPGGYSINWSPGTRLLPLKQAESGHLIVIVDHYDELTTAENPEELSFWTDYRTGDNLNALPADSPPPSMD